MSVTQPKSVLSRNFALITSQLYKKKSHEKQFFNEQLQDKLVDSVTTALKQIPLATEKAKTLIQEGEKLIEVRQKHIKIADRSEYGWMTYE